MGISVRSELDKGDIDPERSGVAEGIYESMLVTRRERS
jgi:hypothetical protein